MPRLSLMRLRTMPRLESAGDRRQPPTIPKNATLVFVIDLVSVG
jgi:FKBP-type peptidyl-prolyl cis-trans isomerase